MMSHARDYSLIELPLTTDSGCRCQDKAIAATLAFHRRFQHVTVASSMLTEGGVRLFNLLRTLRGLVCRPLPTLGPVNPLGRDRDHTYAPACPFHTPFPSCMS
jgi:hypothetical protein